MMNHGQIKSDKREEVASKRDPSIKQYQSLYGQLEIPDEGAIPIVDTPFWPQVDKHAALLAEAHSGEQRANLVLQLQKTYGNAYVQRLVESLNVQAKLTVSSPDDEYEREADRVAETVTRTSVSSIRLQEAQPEEEEEEEGEEQVQTKLFQSQPRIASEDIEAGINAARGGGQPLPDSIRNSLEPKFGHDFSQVCIHTDAQADELSQQLNAEAFTAGSDVFFRDGAYQPGSDSGKRLIAHELTHTIQQGASSRIARWGMFTTSHKTVTEGAFKANGLDKKYDKNAQDYIASFADSMDMRVRMWWHYLKDKIKNKEVLPKMKEDPKAYEKLEGYELNEDESKNHAEGGLYKSEGGEGANKARVQQWVGEAIAAWKTGNTNQALSTLGLGLHTAEDRGAHGEGKPGKGHDPRRMIPAPKGSSVNYYQKDWENKNCDLKSFNEKGYDDAVKYAIEVLQQFYGSVQEAEEPKESFVITMKPANLFYPRWMEKFVRKVAIGLGIQPEEVVAFWSDKLAAMAKWSAEKLTALMNWSAEKLKALMNWSAEKLSALAKWSAEKLSALASWSVEKLAAIGKWSIEKLAELAKWSVEKLTELAKWSVEKLTELAKWSVEKLAAIGKWSIEKLTELASWSAEKLTALASWSLKKLSSITGWITGRLRALASIFS
jgi:hypothetical protein